MTEYLDLNYCADNRLTEDQAWRASRTLGGLVYDSFIEDLPGLCAKMTLDNVGDALCGVSAQPDLTGSATVEITSIEGLWEPSRNQDKGIYRRPPWQHWLQGEAVALSVFHQKPHEKLFSVALPMDPRTAELMRYGRTVQISTSLNSGIYAMTPHNTGENLMYPRHVQTAAWLIREMTTT